MVLHKSMKLAYERLNWIDVASFKRKNVSIAGLKWGKERPCALPVIAGEDGSLAWN